MLVEDPLIPHQRFDTRAFAPDESYEGWRKVTEPVFDVAPVDSDVPFSACFTTYYVGDIVMGVGHFQASHFSRDREKIRRDGHDHILIQFYTEGGYTGDLGEKSVTVRAGEVVPLDLARELRITSVASSNINVFIPRDHVEGRVLPHGHLAPGEEGDNIGGMLADHLRSLVRRLPTLRQSAAPHVAEATIALYKAALAPTADALEAASEPMHDALLMRARRLIEARLVGNDVSAEGLAAAMQVSRSTLYRLFEPYGGVASYVLERRLARARAALRDPGNVRRVGEISDACGFSDPSHFSRVYRRRFGMTPAEARRENGILGGPLQRMPESADFGSWIYNLT